MFMFCFFTFRKKDDVFLSDKIHVVGSRSHLDNYDAARTISLTFSPQEALLLTRIKYPFFIFCFDV